MPKPKDLLFVAIQFILLLALLFDPIGLRLQHLYWIRWGAIAIMTTSALCCLIAIAQLGSSLTPWPTPKVGGQLVTTGVFSIARHPIYSSLLFGTLGYTLFTASLWRAIVLLALFILFQKKAKYEEEMLRGSYTTYDAYADRVRRFGV